MGNSSKFSGPFMQKSPLYDKADRLRQRAKKRSKRLGETQDYAYEDPKVQRLLSKAKKAEQPKPSKDEGVRVSMSYERPDMPPVNYNSPFNEVTPGYGSSSSYVSIQPAIQQLQANMRAAEAGGLVRPWGYNKIRKCCCTPHEKCQTNRPGAKWFLNSQDRKRHPTLQQFAVGAESGFEALQKHPMQDSANAGV